MNQLERQFCLVQTMYTEALLPLAVRHPGCKVTTNQITPMPLSHHVVILSAPEKARNQADIETLDVTSVAGKVP